MAKRQVSIVIPVYNESEAISSVLSELKGSLNTKAPDLEYEIMCVNDCSTDQSANVVSGIAGVHLINHKKNKGYGAALKTGIRAAKYEAVLIMDSDGQHNPDFIMNLLNRYFDGFDMVVGARPINNTKSSRVLGKRFIHVFASTIFGHKIPDINSGLRVFSRVEAMRFLHLCSNRFSFTTSITLAFLSEGLDIDFVPIVANPRTTGVSQVNVKAGLRAVLKIVQVAMVFNPLRIILPIAFGFGILFIGCFSVDILDGDIGDTSVILFVGTVILFTFALVSDQLASLRRDLNSHS